MTYTISKEFTFSAAHHLDRLPKEHQCSRLHGHNYKVRLELGTDKLNEIGFVIDYGDLGFFKRLCDSLDHRNLNDMLGFNPTAENLAMHFCRQTLFHLHDRREQLLDPRSFDITVHVSETDKTWASFTERFA